jgi:hypothetical protein
MKYIQPPGTPEGASYVDFNPATGVEGSVVPALAIEAPQRELIKVIIEAGLEPNNGDLTQLFQAIKLLFAQFMLENTDQLISPSRDEDYAADSFYTVPSYVVGAGQLRIYWRGLHWALGLQYDEVGTVGEISNQIKLLVPLDRDKPFHVYKKA